MLLVAVTLSAFPVHAQAQTIGASAFIGIWQTQFNDSGGTWNNTITVNGDFTWSGFSSTPATATRPAISCTMSGTYVVSAVDTTRTVTSSTISPAGHGPPCVPVGEITTTPFFTISGSGGVGSTFVDEQGRTWTKTVAPATSTTTAIVASGLWNVVTYYPNCNYTELGTLNFTYANGAYSIAWNTSNSLHGNCQNTGSDSFTSTVASAQDLLTTSQFQDVINAVASARDAISAEPCGSGNAGPCGSGLQQVSFTSPDSVSGTVIDPSYGNMSVQMTRATSSPTSYALAVANTGTGYGIVTSSTGGIDCGASCSASFSSGASVSLTATPASGSTFAGWSGDCSGAGSCVVTMSAAKNVTAIFKPVPFVATTTSSITATSATISTTIAFNAADKGKQGSVYVTAWVPSNGLSSFVLSAGQSKAMSVTTTSDNPYLADKVNRRQETLGTLLAATTNTWVLVQKTASGWQLVVNGQLIPYVTGVLGDQLAAQSILDNTDPTNLKGAQFCVGYGTSDIEMIASGRMLPVAIIPDANGKAATNGSCNVTDVVVVEFYNANINHYFMTASLDEAVVLDNKTSWGWARTGKTFNVWLNQATAPGSASPVCRFYGVFANGTVGSHFYTADPVECEYVKGRLDWGWGYENDAFYAVQPTGSSCPSGTSPVYRVYNNGMGGAPNHRYMANQADVSAMVSQGWVSEGTGTAFCGAQ